MKVTRVNGSGWNATKGIWAINLISLEAAKGQKLNTKNEIIQSFLSNFAHEKSGLNETILDFPLLHNAITK